MTSTSERQFSSWKSLGHQCLLVFGNTVMAVGWAHVLVVLITLGTANSLFEEQACHDQLYPAVIRALLLSTVELAHCTLGLTRSKPIFVLLFLVVRGGVEYFAGPNGYFHHVTSCAQWPHLYTVACWSIGEFLRFGCFTVAEMSSSMSSLPKSIRYIVGPIAFPLGAFGEMLMLKSLADHPSTKADHKIWIWTLISLWPFGFAILMKQLLAQKKKHFDSLKRQSLTKKAK
jgi:uncharacterized membrane protein YccF (DUF307 family)